MIKKLLSFCFIAIGINFSANAQATFETDTLKNVAYICQVDSFTVTVSGMHWMAGNILDSTAHSYRNDTLLINLYYKFGAGLGVLSPFQIPLRFQSPQPGFYIIHSNRFQNGMLLGKGTSTIGVCTMVSGLSQESSSFEKLKVYPNPTQNILILECNENDITTQLSDLTGRTILSQNFKHTEQKQLYIGKFKPGIYLLTIKTENGKSVKRIIKI